jgi:hypothetical protein
MIKSLFLCGTILSLACSAGAREASSTQQEQEQQCVCAVRLTAIFHEAEDQSRTTTHKFDCAAAPGQTTTDFDFDTIDLDLDTEDGLYLDNERAMSSGKWFIQFPCDWVLTFPIRIRLVFCVEDPTWNRQLMAIAVFRILASRSAVS